MPRKKGLLAGAKADRPDEMQQFGIATTLRSIRREFHVIAGRAKVDHLARGLASRIGRLHLAGAGGADRARFSSHGGWTYVPGNL